MPKLVVTVPHEFYHAMACACGEPYADSYLSGAVVDEGRLLPRTQVAWRRLTENWTAQKVLRDQKVRLVKPPLFNPMNDPLSASGIAA